MNTNRVNPLLLSFCLCFLLLFGAGQAFAEGQFAEETQRQLGSADLGNPVLSLRVSFMSGIPDLVGASLSLKAMHPFEVEAGVSSLLFGYSLYGKAGVSLSLYDGRDLNGRGWAVRFLAMGGYRYIKGNLFNSSESHSILATLGIETTYWIFHHFGIEAQLSAGGGVWLAHTGTTKEYFYPDLRFSLGFAF